MTKYLGRVQSTELGEAKAAAGEAAGHSASVVRKVEEGEGWCFAFCSFRKRFIQNQKNHDLYVCMDM